MPKLTSGSVTDRGGLPPIDDEPFHWDGDGDGGNSNDRGASRKTSMIGLAVMMSASVMTFTAMAVALVIRRGMGHGWAKMPLPWILWPNTCVLLASSVVLDTARRMLRRGNRRAFNWFWVAGTLLGCIFLCGQTLAWREVHNRGFFIASNPANGFFYILTWTHAAHAVAGLAALIYVAIMALRFQLGPRKRTVVALSTVFWHFLDVLWLILMLMFIYY
jgi:cytochrome c oxidase subunit III